jgi:hypothetical protein
MLPILKTRTAAVARPVAMRAGAISHHRRRRMKPKVQCTGGWRTEAVDLALWRAQHAHRIHLSISGADQNGSETNMNTRQRRPASSFAGPNRSKSNFARAQSNANQNAQKRYAHYLELARTEARSGNTIGAENYYQHAEHYFRAMADSAN